MVVRWRDVLFKELMLCLAHHRFCRFCWAEQQKELPKQFTAGRTVLGNGFLFLTLLLGQQTEKMEESMPSFPQIMQRFFFCKHKFLCAGFLLIVFFPLYLLSQDFLCVLLWSHQFYNYYFEMIVDHSKLLSQTHTLQSFHSTSCCFITPPAWLVMVPAVLSCQQGQQDRPWPALSWQNILKNVCTHHLSDEIHNFKHQRINK